MRKGKFSRAGKTRWTLLILAAAGMMIYACKKNQDDPVSSNGGATIGVSSGQPTTGNGAPSGPHYDLNLIGMDHGKTADMTNTNGHVIFVAMSGTTKILLKQGDFQVLDANGTDGSASFQLPNPDSANSGTTTYSVYARALGKPNGSSFTTLCGTDSLGITYCSGDSMKLVRTTGKSSFTNVSKELLYLYVDINNDGIVDRIPLFDTRLKDYFWNYDNNGLRIAQLRFYQVSTVVP